MDAREKQQTLNSYYKDLIGAINLYIQEITGKGLVCAIIDSGCDCEHVLLKDKIIKRKNFTDEGGKKDVSDRVLFKKLLRTTSIN